MRSRFSKETIKDAVSLAKKGWLNVDLITNEYVSDLNRIAQQGMAGDLSEAKGIVQFLVALRLAGTAKYAPAELREYFETRRSFFDALCSVSNGSSNGGDLRKGILNAIKIIREYDAPSGCRY